MDRGAARGSLNQGVAAMCSFQDDLNLGSGIQSGGFDRVHQVGPAAFELLRLDDSGSIELLVGDNRDSYNSRSGYGPGFSNPFNAYLWKMEVHCGQLYVGTMDTSVFSLFTSKVKLSSYAAEHLDRSDLIGWLLSSGGADLWRTRDGLLWEPVTRNGFDNFYNYGVRTLVSDGRRLFIGTANPFGPSTWNSESGAYELNALGGAEVIMLNS